MSSYRVVVDGSNLATEGRSTPSLAQLDEAVRAFLLEYPGSEVTVVVDASFGHRIDESERPMFEEAQSHGEVISPPAGAVGRGDAFLLRIAERTGAVVLSNDSFQEFHGDHQWLFSRGRLMGGKPVPGVGWIFTPRTPVRGAKSRQAVRDAKATEVRLGSKEASRPMPVPAAPPPGRRHLHGTEASGGAPEVEGDGVTGEGGEEEHGGAGQRNGSKVQEQVQQAIADATEEVLTGGASSGRGRRRRRGAPPQAVNEPLAFITFIAEHSLGALVEGQVERFTSHGAFVTVDGTHCYVPLSGLGSPAPRRARDVLTRGERRTFVLQALDPQRRGVELALPAFAEVSGAPKQETVEAEIAEAGKAAEKAAKAAGGAGGSKKAAKAAGTATAARAVRSSKKAAKAAATPAAPDEASATAAAGTAKKAAGTAKKAAGTAKKAAGSVKTAAGSTNNAATAPKKAATATKAAKAAGGAAGSKKAAKAAGTAKKASVGSASAREEGIVPASPGQ
jgi:hypothetical protein